ncbi:MAG: T9SS type A sorting domain-containing protein [Ignavibacteriaceae bacterium]|nr:T9SS type A sorting domain-containing protein [Ignavibacteriaceae bacterium]
MSGVLLDLAGGVVINVPIADSGSFVVPNPYVFIGLKMMIDFNMEMPAELISFNATSLDNNVTLDWSTATETNNSGFEINRKKLEARSQEAEWETIGFVPGFGTTTEPKSYSFIDEKITTGIYKYRLKQIDFDGSFEYLPIGQAGSNEIEVEVDFTPKKFVLFQNYPNPFNPNTVIRFEIPGQARNDNMLVTLKVYDVLGNEVATLVNEEKQVGIYEVEFSVGHPALRDSPDMATGIYFYQLRAGQFTETKKMLMLK